MFVEYAVQVNAIEQHRGAQAYRSQIRPEVQLERPALYTQVRHGLLRIESALIHGCAPLLGSVRSCRRCSSRGAQRDLDVSPGRFRVLHPVRLAGGPGRAARRAGISRPKPRSTPRHRSMACDFGGAIDNCFEYSSYQEDAAERGRSGRRGRSFRLAEVSRTIFPGRLLHATGKLGRYALLISCTDINVKYEY